MKSLCWKWILSICVFFIIVLGETATSKTPDVCPTKCTCSKHFRKVNCENQRLETIPTGIPVNATILLLGHNFITRINRSTFLGLSNLIQLSLVNNGLINIEEGAFNGLSALKSLFLTHNSLGILPDGVFSGLGNLQHLYLSQNQLTQIPKLGPLISLITINVDNNHLKSAKFSDENVSKVLTSICLSNNPIDSVETNDFAPLQRSHIHKFDFSRCDLKSVEQGAFSHFPTLQSMVLSYNSNLGMTSLKAIMDDLGRNSLKLASLSLSGCITAEIPADTFHGLSNVTLKHLDLRHSSNWHVLQNGVFSSLNTLEELDFTNTQLEQAEDEAFSGLNSLRTLKLHHSRLEKLPVFPLPQLTSLDLSHSVLEYLGAPSKYSFINCANLQNLSFARSFIRVIYKGAFTGLVNLKSLDLSFNSLAGNSIGVNVLADLINLRYLNLGYNKLKEIINEGKLFSELSALEVLNMRNNSCESLPKDIFSNLLNLKTLQLEGNRMDRALAQNPELFTDLSNLQVLNLQDNHIEEITKTMVQGLQALRELHLVSNRVTAWTGDTFSNNTHLELINLTSNHISIVNRLFLAGLPGPLQLDLSDNPFDCSCDLIWFRDQITYHFNDTPVLINLSRVEGYRCDSPEAMQGEPLLSFNTQDIYTICFPPPWKIIIIIVTCGSVLFITSCASTAYRKRWHIHLAWYRFRKWKRQGSRPSQVINPANGYETIKGEDSFQEYHATVSYCSSCDRDKSFVRDILVPRIDKEHEGPFEIFLQDKVEDNECELGVLADAIECSQKQILVVSTEYLKDGRKQLEMELAMKSVGEQGTGLDAIILILLEESAAVKLPQILRNRTRDQPQLVWTENDGAGQDLFWQTLREELEKVLPARHLEV